MWHDYGLDLCWDLGYRNVEVEVFIGCALAINIISRDQLFDHSFQDVILKAREFLFCKCNAPLSFMYRHLNCTADCLARKSHELDFAFCIFDQPLCFVLIGGG